MKQVLISAAQRAYRMRHRAGILGRPHAVVLMYHRVATPAVDPFGLSVSPAHFAEHLQVLRDWGRCMTFADLTASLTARRRPRRTVAITFDDGYVDNLNAACPLLEAQDTPATVFVASGSTGTGRDFWWDALARVFLATPHLPPTLTLQACGRTHVWQLGQSARRSAEELQGLVTLHVRRGAVRDDRMRLLSKVWRVLFDCPTSEIERLCTEIVVWAGVDRAGPVGDRAMTAAEVASLSGKGLVEIGGHTVTHPPLDRLSTEEAAAEIGTSRSMLREITGREVTTFAYPFGRFRAETCGLVKAAGYVAACSGAEFVAVSNVDPFQIPRVTIHDCDGEAFARFLRQVAGA